MTDSAQGDPFQGTIRQANEGQGKGAGCVDQEAGETKKKGEPYDSVMAMKPLDVQVGVSSELDPDRNVTFSFPTPLAKADTAGIHLYAKHDTLWYRAPMDLASAGNRRYELRGRVAPGYRI